MIRHPFNADGEGRKSSRKGGAPVGRTSTGGSVGHKHFSPLEGNFCIILKCCNF